ncbi:MAG TPA: hypothetical protein DCS93_35790 [Microscillaceae bacterium]|nr:hypothetical protein [Microscillaceae bacterium]
MKKALKPIYLLLGLIIGWSIPSFAQNFNIIETDTTKFPTLKVKILLPDGGKASEQDFKVYDEKDPNTTLSISLETPDAPDSSNADTKKDRLIFILVDGSAIMNGVPINSIKRALANSFGVFSSTDKVNVGFFTDTDEVTLVTPGFNNKFNYLSQEIRSKIEAAPPVDSTGEYTAKLYASIYKILQDIHNDDMEGQKILVVVSSGQNKGSAFTSSDCIARARQMEIPIYSITYQMSNDDKVPDGLSRISSEVRVDKASSGSPSRIVKTAGEIQNALSDFFAIKEEVVVPQGTTLFLSFDTDAPADGNQHSYMIDYKGQNQTQRYFTPYRPESGESFFKKYSIYLIIAAGALLGIVLWTLYNRRMKQAEEERIAEEEEAEAEEQARLAAEAAQRRQQEAMARRQQEETSKQNEATDQRLKALEEQNIRLQEQIRSQQLQAQNQPTPDPKFDMKRTIISGGGGAPTLMVSAGSFSHTFALNKPKIFIGRAQENDVMIPVQTVSGQHATITIENGSFYLTDLGSTNGTFVNGSRVSKTILKSGDMIKLGAANLKFHI